MSDSLTTTVERTGTLGISSNDYADSGKAVRSMELLERRVIQLLKQHGPQSCTQIGEQLFGGKRNRQAYARPAGKVLHSLRRKGLVEQTRQGCAEYHAASWRLSNVRVSESARENQHA